MRTDEFIRWKALSLKAESGNREIIDYLLENNETFKQDAKMRNLCAMVSNELFDEVENICGLLGISKRIFIENALIDFVDKSHSIIKEVNPFEFREIQNADA